MLQSSLNSTPQKSQYFPSQNSSNTLGATTEQATIGRSMVIKGEVTAGESLYIDGQIEGSVTVTDHRVTVGRNGSVKANIIAREVVIMGKVLGNVQCADRLDIRSEGSLTGDVITQRVSVEDGAIVKGSVEVRHTEKASKSPEAPKPAAEAPKALAATASN